MTEINLIVLKSIHAGVNLNEELHLNRCEWLKMMAVSIFVGEMVESTIQFCVGKILCVL